ncbi:putative methyltransferase YcgJ [Anaerolineae bacterium]|nr:putative methyltransferase YcgJ [Anaerolineae bacterium]
MLSLGRQETLRERYKREHPRYLTSRDIYEELLATYIRSDSKVLDAGCGQAGIVERVMPIVKQAVGLDQTFENYRETIKLRDLVQGKLVDLPFSPNSFDVISCTWVLEHLKNPQRVFREFARVLCPDGILLFLAPNAHNYITWINRSVPNWLHKLMTHALYGRERHFTFPVYYRANTKSILGDSLNRLNFVCECFQYVGDPTYIAFNEPLYRLGVALERLTDFGRIRHFKIHFVAAYRYRG